MRLSVALAALVLSGCTLSQARWAYAVGAAADMTTTQIALNDGLREANPFVPSGVSPVAWSAGVTAASFGIGEWWGKHDPKGATWFYSALACIRGAAAISNTVQIRRHRNEQDIDRRRSVYAAARVSF